MDLLNLFDCLTKDLNKAIYNVSTSLVVHTKIFHGKIVLFSNLLRGSGYFSPINEALIGNLRVRQ